MKCPKCRATIEDGKLYCERCGQEIQIVPEFEPEIENSIHATLSKVADEITVPRVKQEGEKSVQDTAGSLPDKDKRPGRVFWILALVVLCLAAVFLYAGIQYYSPETQYEKAQAAFGRGQYEKALAKYERAAALSPTNVSYLNGLSRCYQQLGQEKEAERVCLETVLLEGSNEEAYERLIAVYEGRGDYERINELMQSCKDQAIRSRYSSYMANPPDAAEKGGTYHEVMSISLLGNTSGTIYYTLDGSDPDEDSAIYTNPIVLEAGNHILKAFFVNSYGVKSQMTQERYSIDVELPRAPQIVPQSGTYARPHCLEIEAPKGCEVYYTVDGSEPDSNSILYEGELWMPVGRSRLRFVAISAGGVRSETVERDYTLDLHALLSMEAASNQLMLTLKNAGVLQNLLGDVPGKEGRNLYTYRYTLTINGHNYYFYREYYEQSEGISNATGKDYVVNYMSGECYQAIRQEDRSFKLYRIEGEAGEEAFES